jgi:lysosomal Pro-X carboxypeptidase
MGIEQVLLDYVHLINYIKLDLRLRYHINKEVAAITIGSSYAGLLSMWLRMKFPNAVLGAIAVGAPHLAFDS